MGAVAEVLGGFGVPERVDIPEADADCGEDAADFLKGFGGDVLGVAEDEEVGVDVAAGFDEGFVGFSLTHGFAADGREHAGAVVDREGIDEVAEADEAVVDFLILVPQVGAVLVELEVGGVDDAHGGRLRLPSSKFQVPSSVARKSALLLGSALWRICSNLGSELRGAFNTPRSLFSRDLQGLVAADRAEVD